ncbi:flavin reductase [Serratia sp. MYb239]|uniref:flavin reductase family protein n=1 Tax=Serratia sp. MYb239 TaxID=2033438 RepID=UPI000CF6969F|nr:flavin reductase family protein [Serratia sp. MYb239]AVJ16780.1 flavin reductase [Serratia sp. MYb239]QPT14778.1 flavin reductase family protein [Serratia rubidaea]
MDIEQRRQLRDAFGAFMTGVTVVTGLDADGQPIGFTANSFTSVSLDPALLLVNIDKRSANLANFTDGAHFAVNILAEQQKETSNIFAQKVDDRFAQVAWRRSAAGVPLLDGSSAWFECERFQVVDAGDHVILIGKISAFDSSGTAGLGYYRGAYFTPAQNAESLVSGPEVVVSALIEFDGSVVMVKQQDGRFRLPSRSVAGRSVGDSLTALLQELALPASPGFVYSIYDDRQSNSQHIVFLCALPSDAGDSVPQGEQACWLPLAQTATLPIDDAALKSMLNRFVRENSVGNYSIYYGDEHSGAIKRFAS